MICHLRRPLGVDPNPLLQAMISMDMNAVDNEGLDLMKMGRWPKNECPQGWNNKGRNSGVISESGKIDIRKD